MAEVMERGTTVYKVEKEGPFPIRIRKVTDLRLEDGVLVLTLSQFEPDPDQCRTLVSRKEETVHWPVDNLFLSYHSAGEYRKELIRKKVEELGTESKETLLKRILFLMAWDLSPKEELFWLKFEEQNRLYYETENEKAKLEYIKQLLETYVEKEKETHEENG